MGKFKKDQVSEFSLVGRFLGFEMEDGYKLKRLRLATAEGEVSLKAAKELRASLLGRDLIPGEWVQVSGEKKLKLKTGEVTLKAYQAIATTPGQIGTLPSAPAPSKPFNKVASAPSKACVLVCQKSDCRKRGSGKVCDALESALSDRGLEGQVTVKGTGCMKHCKSGPHVVFMPNKTRYSQVHPTEISTLVDKHFPSQTHIVEQTSEPSPVD